MKIVIPHDDALNRDIILNEFLEEYYPYLDKKNYSFLSLSYPGGEWVQLKNSISECAYFLVEQKPIEDSTVIYLVEGATKAGRAFGADILRLVGSGKFYDELYNNFISWLKKKHGFAKDDIKVMQSSLAREVLVYLLGVLLLAFIFSLFDEPVLLFILPVAIVLDILLIWRRKKKQKTIMTPLANYKEIKVPKFLMTFGKVFFKAAIGLLLLIVLWFVAAYAYDVIFSPGNYDDIRTKTYVKQESEDDNDNNNDYYGVVNDVVLKHLPTNTIIKNIEIEEEVNGYALGIRKGEYDVPVLCTPEGKVIQLMDNPNIGYYYVRFFTPDIIEVCPDGIDYYFGLDGKPVKNMTTWALSEDGYVLLATIIPLVLWVLLVLLYFLWSRKRKKKNADLMSTEETPTQVDEEDTIRGDV